MRAEAQLTTPVDAPVAITLRGTLGEFEALATAIRSADIPFYQVQAMLDQIGEVSRTLRGKVISAEPEEQQQ
jgi:hypothetical protein